MQDRRQSVTDRLPLLLPRERRSPSSSAPSPDGSDDNNNPFAPPPEDKPEQPWRPRRPESGDTPPEDTPPPPPNPWGGQWSNQQPGRQDGGFGGGPRPQRPDQGGSGGPGGQRGPGLRWDVTDPAQRRARYALLAGIWAFFCAFNFWQIGLLLGSLALYWGISSLRAKPKPREDGSTPPPGTPKPQTTAAVAGVVTAGLALAIIAATFTVQIVYRDYYSCVDDALTQSGKIACNDKLPKSLVNIFGTQS
ncbi:hypothetical protein [Streptomyces sp. NBC_01465]|uniref:hypothetical protein n=1 Tax=Streptomyces sp. NBC_01465 TaxID=2903878 RepID=UPI002E3377C9|nr:hypothetical protein [Streptomyces sp. NBC_01465]